MHVGKSSGIEINVFTEADECLFHLVNALERFPAREEAGMVTDDWIAGILSSLLQSAALLGRQLFLKLVISKHFKTGKKLQN